MIKRIFLLFLSVVCITKINSVYAQNEIIVDRVVAVLGGSVVFQSEIEQQLFQAQAQKEVTSRCEVFENLMIQKLLLNQAKVDSIEVTDANVEMQLENRIKYFIEQAGSKEKLEAYFNKSLFQIKEDMRGPLKEQMITQRMQGNITGDIKVTPSDVKEFMDTIPSDSIPMINATVEYQQILIYPANSDKAIFDVKEKLLSLRKRIVDGEKFATLAYLYSEDPGSARNGGEIGFMSRGQLDPEYAKVAFSLKDGAVSNIVESEFGYHIIQCITHQDDKVNTRHILMRPRAGDKDIKSTIAKLDSLLTILKQDTVKFEYVAYKYSQDKNSYLNGGKVINPYNNSLKFELDQLPQEDYYVIKKMNVGDISDPFYGRDDNHKEVYKIIKLISKSTPHKATLENDYQFLQNLTIEGSRKKVFMKWVAEKQKTTFIRIDDSFKTCPLKNKGWFKE